MKATKIQRYRLYQKAYLELLVSSFTLVMSMGSISAFLPIFSHELDPSGILVGLVVSVWFLSRIFTEIPSGILADNIGRYRLLAAGLVLSTLGAFLCSFANAILILIVGRAIWGLGTGLFFMSSMATIFDLFPSNIRGRALGMFQAIEFAGSFIGAPIGSFMAVFMGYRIVFLMATGLMLISCLITFISKDLQRIEVKDNNKNLASFSLEHILNAFKKRDLIAVYVTEFFRMLIWMGIISTVFPLYLNLNIGVTTELIGVIISLNTLGLIVATAISGRLSDTFGRKPMIAVGMLLEASSLYALTSITLLEVITLFSIMEGFGRGMILTSLMVLLSDLIPQALRGSAIGAYRTFMDVGGFVGPLFFMFVYEELGSYFTFVSAVVIVFIMLAIILTVKTPQNKRP